MLNKLLSEGWEEDKQETERLGEGYIVLQREEFFLLYDLERQKVCYKYSRGRNDKTKKI